MTYQPHTWTKGETITAQLLQNMDNGVAAAIDALESAFGSNYTMGSKEYKVNFTDLGKDISANKITGTTLTATDAISGATISGATLTATATTGTGLTVNGETNLQGALIVGTDNTAVDTTIKGKLIVNGKDDNSSPVIHEAATLTGKVNITGNIIVGDANTSNSIENKIYGTTTLFGKLEVQSNEGAHLQNSLTVDGNSFINSNFYHQINQVQENDGSTTWFPNGVFYAYYKTIDLGMRGEMINADQPRERIISEENSSTINLAGTRLNISNTTTNISSPTTEIEGNLIIGDDPTNNIYTHTVTIKANSTLNGVTTIRKLDQLIVGDSTTTADNEIYGFTTISDLTVGKAADEENEQPATGSTVLYGTTTFNTTANILHGTTSIDNLTVNAITLNTGIHINQYASETNTYGLIVEKDTLFTSAAIFAYDSTQKGFKFQVQETTPSTNLIIEPYSIGNKDSTLQFKNSDLILTSGKVLKINETSLSEDDIKHLHTLWTNYGGE